jgi:hypothetical protein
VNGNPIVRVLAFVLLIAVAIGIGATVYNAGIAAGIAQQAVQSGQPVVVPYAYGPYWHGGFGFFGIFFWIIGFFLIIGLLRAAFGRGRGWGHRGGWGAGGYGKWGYGGPGRFGPGPGDSREDAISEWHKELHRREESAGTGNSGTGSSGSSGSSSTDQPRTGG